jgi:hypothetical protein
MFSQVLKLILRAEFEHIVKQTKAEYATKGFSSWGQLVAMLFRQLGRAHSLREIDRIGIRMMLDSTNEGTILKSAPRASQTRVSSTLQPTDSAVLDSSG